MSTDYNSTDDLISSIQENKVKIVSTDDTAMTEYILIKQFHEESQNNMGFAQTMENQAEESQTNLGFAQSVENQESNEEDTIMIEAVSGVGYGYDIVGINASVQNQAIDNGDDEKSLDDNGFEGIDKNRKKARRAKRRGKRQNWNGRTVENEKVLQCGNVYEKKHDWIGLMYSREEMESLRFVNKEDQMKKWVEVYCGLGPVVTKEYDGLIVHQNKEDGLDFDPRKNMKKRVSASEIMGGGCSQAVDNKMNPLDTASEPIGCDLNGCTVTEDECCEDDDSDEEYNSIQRPAFLVTGAPNFDSGPAMDGLEYLRRVRWETERVQKVTFAKIEESKLSKQTVYIPKIPEIAKCPQHLLPLKEWETAFLDDFSELRLAISRYESSNTGFPGKLQSISNILEEDYSFQILGSEVVYNSTDGTGTNNCSMQSSARDKDDVSTISCPKIVTTEDITNSPELSTINCSMQSAANDGDDVSPAISSSKTVTTGDIANSPTLATVLGMEPVARVSMLKKRIKLAEEMTSLSKNDCVWLFALCAAVDTPLNAETSAALRDLLRKCASLRAEKSELDDEVVMLNILATISGKYFGQLDN